MGSPCFSFALRGSVAFEGSERGRSVSVVGGGRGFGVEGREGEKVSIGSDLFRP